MKGARVLCVIAHPDDECVAFGGALALAAKQGAEVSIVCLTDGQAATHRGSAKSGAELGAIRREEFRASCEVLGAHRHELLDYQDGKLEFACVAEVAGLLVERIRRWQPHVIFTFGLDGAVNTHPDHSMVSAMTSMASQWACRTKRYPEQLEAGLSLWRPQKLYQLTTDYFIPGRELLNPAPWTLELDVREVKEVKIRAFEQHTSQLPIMEKFRALWEEKSVKEVYTLTAVQTPGAARMETDIFSGLVL